MHGKTNTQTLAQGNHPNPQIQKRGSRGVVFKMYVPVMCSMRCPRALHRCTNRVLALLCSREAMGDDCSPMSGRRRESTSPGSMWSQSARIMSAGGLLGVLMSVVYYRALGPPQVWVENIGRGGGGGSWWLGGGKAGSVHVAGSLSRYPARNLGSMGGGWKIADA